MHIDTSLLLEGFLIGLTLIIPIGTQNAYVLRQGALGRHWFATSLTCAICDSLLLIAGAFGLGAFISSSILLRKIAVIGGVSFLGWYGTKSFKRALTPHSNQMTSDQELAAPLKTVLLTAIAFSLLNPHAILDTTILIGSIAGQYSSFVERSSFCLGAVISSWVWFFSWLFLKTLKTFPLKTHCCSHLRWSRCSPHVAHCNSTRKS